MARKKKHSGSKRKIPLKILEQRAAHVVRLVHARGGKVAGVDSSHKRRTKHRRSR